MASHDEVRRAREERQLRLWVSAAVGLGGFAVLVPEYQVPAVMGCVAMSVFVVIASVALLWRRHFKTGARALLLGLLLPVWGCVVSERIDDEVRVMFSEIHRKDTAPNMEDSKALGPWLEDSKRMETTYRVQMAFLHLDRKGGVRMREVLLQKRPDHDGDNTTAQLYLLAFQNGRVVSERKLPDRMKPKGY
ncbi:hypothetical protein DES53_102600 [Roseimicrobium gellanilyticum]|uniref:Uncharacterized protein n=1 Tax=Roseimicrobium gellanilyticum TaxID=748857 RepID=A0A366HTG8_9BACT|nr:hypothetical protein [Roseimicrobium gellanilyticum]RBP46214.1 hypothetical protein DES53_102600 [Roseimicrobium gellanilyticum]